MRRLKITYTTSGSMTGPTRRRSCTGACRWQTGSSMCPCNTACRYTGHTFAKFIVTFVIGVTTGCIAVALSQCVTLLVDRKLDWIQEVLDEYKEQPYMATLYAFLWWWLFGGVLGALATSMVRHKDSLQCRMGTLSTSCM